MARELTEQQFSVGTTIDGERLDAAMQDATERFNAVRPRNIRRRFLPTRYVMGWTPNHNVVGDSGLPWLPQENAPGDIVQGGGTTNNITNALRTKGVQVPGNYPLSTWSTALYFRRPVVLHRLTYQMQTVHPTLAPVVVGGRNNGFLYSTDAPEGYINGSDAEDVSVTVSVDSIFDPENRAQADKEVACHRFRVAKEKFTQVAIIGGGLPAPTVDAFPSDYPAGPMHGHYMDLVDLNIPLHERSRVRVDVTLPRYPSGDSVHSGWNENNFWHKQCFDLCLVVLEEVE